MKSIYQKLGLSEIDIKLIEKYQLTYLLDKIRDQQSELERQKEDLEKALTNLKDNLSAARDAQMCLLPNGKQEIQNVKYSARFLPSQFVSGDIYNIFRLDEKNVGLYHIDISGHGVPAALFSVSLSQTLNTNVSTRNMLKVPAKKPPYYKINPPDEVIKALEEDHSYETAGIYFTMIYMILNIEERKISFTRAGHNLPIIIKANGGILMPEAGGLPIGWDYPRDDQVVDIYLDEGDRIFLYSDGITEATNYNDEMFSVDRLVDNLKNSRKDDLDKSLDALINKLHYFTGTSEFEDDVSIIGLDIQ